MLPAAACLRYLALSPSAAVAIAGATRHTLRTSRCARCRCGALLFLPQCTAPAHTGDARTMAQLVRLLAVDLSGVVACAAGIAWELSAAPDGAAQLLAADALPALVAAVLSAEQALGGGAGGRCCNGGTRRSRPGRNGGRQAVGAAPAKSRTALKQEVSTPTQLPPLSAEHDLGVLTLLRDPAAAAVAVQRNATGERSTTDSHVLLRPSVCLTA